LGRLFLKFVIATTQPTTLSPYAALAVGCVAATEDYGHGR
jgi:hypothetical protein